MSGKRVHVPLTDEGMKNVLTALLKLQEKGPMLYFSAGSIYSNLEKGVLDGIGESKRSDRERLHLYLNDAERREYTERVTIYRPLKEGAETQISLPLLSGYRLRVGKIGEVRELVERREL